MKHQMNNRSKLFRRMRVGWKPSLIPGAAPVPVFVKSLRRTRKEKDGELFKMNWDLLLQTKPKLQKVLRIIRKETTDTAESRFWIHCYGEGLKR